MKPLARWTIGKTIRLGEEILAHSVRLFRRLYPEFDLVVCYNNMSGDQISRLERLGVPLHGQSSSELDQPLTPVDSEPGWKYSMPGWGWKLVPPRLRRESHELWIDNDIVIRERLSSIDAWLAGRRGLISTGRQRAYGIYDELIPEGVVLCAGFFGLPPGYDFADGIRRHCQRLDGGTLGYYDEQGVTSCCVLETDPVVVPFEELSIIKTLTKPLPPGLHFVGANRTPDHQAWRDYRCYALM